MSTRFLVSSAVLLASAAVVGAQNATPDLTAMIECRVEASDYNAFAMDFALDPGTGQDLGWIEIEQPNPLLRDFRLPGPIPVFGRETERIAFSATGPMAMLDGVDAQALAAELGVAPVIDTPEKFLGEKVVYDVVEDEDGLKTRTRVALNVSTVDTHPGLVLAGCSYSIAVE